MNLSNALQIIGRFRSWYLLAALVLFCSPTGYSQGIQMPLPPPGSSISVKAELVVLPVRVTDEKGDFISGLSSHDFEVYEDGRLQDITLFQQEDTPVAVGLVVDHSRSMGPRLAEVSTAIVSFAQQSNPQDEMFVVDFNDEVSLELPEGKPFTHSYIDIEKAIGAVAANGQTALYDAVNEGLNHLQLSHADKKALIIVSDGGDNASQHTYAQVLALAERSQAVIYSIGLIDPTSAEANPGLLRRLCKDSGGIAFFPETGESVAEISAQIARDLRAQYTLGFVPARKSAPNAFHRIRVKMIAPGHGKTSVRTRSGYFDAAESQSRADFR